MVATGIATVISLSVPKNILSTAPVKGAVVTKSLAIVAEISGVAPPLLTIGLVALTSVTVPTVVLYPNASIKAVNCVSFKVKTFAMIGHPSETYDDVQATRDFLIEANPDDFDIAMTQPYPGSRMYRDAVPSTKHDGYAFEYKGLYFNKPRFSQDVAFHKGIPGTYECHVRTDQLSAKQITRLRDSLEMEVRRKIC